MERLKVAFAAGCMFEEQVRCSSTTHVRAIRICRVISTLCKRNDCLINW